VDKGIGGSEGVIAALALLLVIAAAEQTGTLTLACQGTTRLSIDGSPWSPDEPSSMSIIVNFTTNTVTGLRHGDLGYDDEFPVAITGVNDLIVMFGGSKKYGDGGSENSSTITGVVYRMTDDVYVTWKERTVTRTYSLNCKPT
jgi:hypothetical protein